ncbi:hypothetical protein [Arthrobacter rhizosphaerae]|nr:hypothetical protein [Arthrobacter rhizosphaerae]
MLMGAAGAVGGRFSGLVMSWIGYQGLNLVAVSIASLVVAVMLASKIRS